ncbi:MAG: hypothetical protein WBF90_00600 [Rivularia sp. (in: cyanobacteria)]
MHPKFESFTEDKEFIVLNNIIFNTNQIKENIVHNFKHENLSLNFCSKNKFLKKYFREVNNQGIFNRIEWKFCLKEDIKCDLITFGQVKALDQLQIKVILDFSKKVDLKILLDFCIRDLVAEETPTIDNIETISFKDLYEQNTAYFHSFSSKEICI